MLAQVSWLPTTVASTHVLPLKRELMLRSASIDFSMAAMHAVKAAPQSAGNLGCENSMSGSRSRKNCDTWCPTCSFSSVRRRRRR